MSLPDNHPVHPYRDMLVFAIASIKSHDRPLAEYYRGELTKLDAAPQSLQSAIRQTPAVIEAELELPQGMDSEYRQGMQDARFKTDRVHLYNDAHARERYMAGYAKGAVREFLIRHRDALAAAPAPVAQEPSPEFDYAKALATLLHKRYYPQVKDWKALDSTIGVLTQIDNMISGLQKSTVPEARAIPDAVQAAYEDCARACDIMAEGAKARWEDYVEQCRKNPATIGAGSQSWHHYYENAAEVIRLKAKDASLYMNSGALSK